MDIITAGRELDIRIAKLVGWKVVEEPTTLPSGRIFPYMLKDPQGRSETFFKTVEDAWDYSGLPAYSTDVNAALELFDELPDHCTPRLVRMKWPQGFKWKAAIIVSDGLRVDYQIEHEDDSAATAICHVWMDYQEYHNR